MNANFAVARIDPMEVLRLLGVCILAGQVAMFVISFFLLCYYDFKYPSFKIPLHKKIVLSLFFELFWYEPFKYWAFKGLEPGITYEKFLEVTNNKIFYRIVAHKVENPNRTDLTEPEFLVNYDVRQVHFYKNEILYIGEPVVTTASDIKRINNICCCIAGALDHPILEYEDYEHGPKS